LFRVENEFLHNDGFTLLELMFVLALIAIVTSLAAPNFSEIVQQNRLESNAKSVFNMIRLARANALTLGQPIYIGNVDNDTDWSKDLLIWNESALVNPITYSDAADEKIFSQDIVGSPAIAAVINNVSANNFGFTSDGFVRENAEVNISFCDARLSEGFSITVLVSGLAVLQDDPC
jgi:prepilin-type N-terminal cleavage/methylation domain-containing protein